MSRRVVLASVAAIVVVAIGVGAWAYASSSAGGEHRTATQPVGRGYLFTNYGDAVSFLQLANDGRDYEGSLEVATITGQAPDRTTNVDTRTVSLRVNGDGSIAASIDSSAPIFGKRKGDTLVLDMPQKDGSLVPLTFMPATAVEYNKALATLRQTAAQDNAAEVQRQEQARQQQAADANAIMNSLADQCVKAGGQLRHDVTGANACSFPPITANGAWEPDPVEAADTPQAHYQLPIQGFSEALQRCKNVHGDWYVPPDAYGCAVGSVSHNITSFDPLTFDPPL